MLTTEYVHERTLESDRELRELARSRPRYDRSEGRRHSRLREALRSLALPPAKAIPGSTGHVPDVVIRPATATDARVLLRLAEVNERRLPSGIVLVGEVEAEVVAALPLEGHVLSDFRRPTGDVVQLLELRSEQLRAAKVA